MIQFPGKEIPEKQQITFSAEIHSSGKQRNFNKKINNIVLYKFLTMRNIKERSTIRFQIDHTERTWGDDLETIISTHTDEIIKTDNKLDRFYNIARLVLAPMMLILSLYLLVVNIGIGSAKKISNIITNAKA